MICSLLVGACLGEGHRFLMGRKKTHLPGVHHFLVTAVRETSLLSFLYFTFCISCLVISVRQVGPPKLRTELTEGPVKSGPDTNSPFGSLPEKGKGHGGRDLLLHRVFW